MIEDYIDKKAIKSILRQAYRNIDEWASQEKIDEKIRWFWSYLIVESDGENEDVIKDYYETLYPTLNDVVDDLDPSEVWIKDLAQQLIDFYIEKDQESL